MSETKIANRYAQSLFKTATEKNCVDAVASDMRNLADLCLNSKDFVLFIQSPIVNSTQKKKALNQIFANFNEISKNAILVMADKGRESALQFMANQFLRLFNIQNKITQAEITSATSLDESTLKRAEDFVKANTGATRVEIVQKIDANMIGGIQIMFDGKLYDSSISTQINKIKKELNIA